MAVISAGDLATALSIADATRLHAVCSALVERYAPGAPDDVKSEALIRAAGWLHGQTPAMLPIRVLDVGGDAVKIEPRTPAASALRASGGAALLSLWRVRRAVRAAEVAS